MSRKAMRCGWNALGRTWGVHKPVFRRSFSDASPELPDYNTSINVHEHKLTRPGGKPNSTVKWKGLTGLKDRTQDSLVPITLKEMEESDDFKLTEENLRKLGQQTLTKEERKKRQRALDNLGVPNFLEFCQMKAAENGIIVPESTLQRRRTEVLQVNVGLYCNQACNHCHVESSPRRKEMMSRPVAERCLHLLENSPHVKLLDITGGAPELCTDFRFLTSEAHKLNKDVLVRSNLTALLEPGQEDTGEFLAEHRVNVVASLPCYSAKNVNTQRGKGVFDRSIQALLVLNELGYGKSGTGLKLDLVYNPLGGFLPPPQMALEEKYREELWSVFGIEFSNLFTITNMPIKRFADFLHRRGDLESYMQLLVRNFNLAAVDNVMCRSLLSVAWDGRLYDCDFNQQLSIPVDNQATVFDIESCEDLQDIVIATDNHCYGCTAGMGSS
ncbi:uncharacterized protein LOC128230259 isoform X1 [Mya arenaria]|uniref:uncharacterized protein LOC128230259 isoform X1 n=2 Tax=Mya arenaria TaxID=6604 RepID=UPI0022E70E4C|nr:uncharacterized protein LOC128230259 isoform X1 [Mya arenaria]